MGLLRNTSPFGKRLKYARKMAGLTQANLGRLVDIDPSSAGPRINQYEKGTHSPTFQTVRILAKILKVPTHYFYIEDDQFADLTLDIQSISIDEIRNILDKVSGK